MDINFRLLLLKKFGISQISSSLRNKEYPGTPLLIKSSLYIDITNITFDNIYFVETIINQVTTNIGTQAQAIGLMYCKGIANFGIFTIRNQAGIDVSEITSIIDKAEVSYLLTALLNERSSIGVLSNNVSDPYYYIDFGFKTSIITLYSPEASTTDDYENSLSSISFSEINMYIWVIMVQKIRNRWLWYLIMMLRILA